MPAEAVSHPFTNNPIFCISPNNTSTLKRHRLLERCTGSIAAGQSLVVIEGQAGQGKTVFAAQIVQHLNAACFWYQLTEQDADPVFLFRAIHAGLCHNLDNYRSPLMERMVISGEICKQNLDQLVPMLAADLLKSVSGQTCVVLDDLHLLKDHPAALKVLTELISLSQSHVRFVCCTRHDGSLLLTDERLACRTLHIDNDSLRLDRTEISCLFNECLELSIDRELVNRLETVTQGWPAALMVLGERLRSGRESELRDIVPNLILNGTDVFSRYFTTEILPLLAPDLVHKLLKLSLFDTIDIPTAQMITGDAQIDQELETLVTKNLFVRKNASGCFVLHDLFKDVLTSQARQTFDQEQINAILRQAGGFYLQRNEVLVALNCFLQARDFSTAEQLISRVGLALLAVNQTTTLAELLSRIPTETINQSPWFNLFSGILRLTTDPAATYIHYETARQLFVAGGDTRGEMPVLTQLIHFHLYVDGRHNQGRKHLHRLEELFQAHRDQLDPVAVMRFANAIAGGYCFFEFDAAKIDAYSDLAMEHARNLDLPNYLTSARVVHCYRHSFFGNWRAFDQEMEQALPLLGNPRVAVEHKLGLIMAQISVLIMKGDFANYLRKKSWLLEAVGKDLAARSVVAPFLTIYDINMLIAQEQEAAFQDLITAALRDKGPGAIPHQRSQILHFAALAAALENKVEATVQAASESRRLRVEVGPGRFDALNQIILGTAFTLINQYEPAEEYFSAALTTVETMHEKHLIASARFNRAYLHLCRGDEDAVHSDLSAALKQMREQDYHFFFGWVPRIMRQLLQWAVDKGLEVETACNLAKGRLGLVLIAKKTVLPVLDIQVTGDFVVSLADQKIAGIGDFSSAQRQCLALLLCGPEQCMTQEQVQVIIWPDGEPEKARSSFDTMLSRLRKNLADLIGSRQTTPYLVLQKGVLALQHIQSDIWIFREQALTALDAARKEEYWRAENHFHRAMSAWHGRPFAHFPADETVDQARFELESLHVKAVQVWSTLLIAQRRVGDAIELISAALKLNPTDHDLVKALYQLHARAGQAAAAAKVVQNYRTALVREEYLPQEIDAIIDSLWDADTPL